MPPRDHPLTHPPKIDALRLPRLTEGGPDDLEPGAELAGVHVRAEVGAVALRGARLWACHLDGLVADELELGGARLQEVRLDIARIPVVRAGRADWHDVEVTGRLGSVEAHDARWRSVRLRDAKIDYLNLRAAELVDVELLDCTVGELDLGEATLRRVALTRVHVNRVDVRRAELHDVDLRGADLEQVDGVEDLRGATVSAEQLTLLAPLLADGLGIRVED